jgi:hypothetical protein
VCVQKWGLNSGLSTWKSGALTFEPCLRFILLSYFGDGGSHKIFAWAGL